MENKNSFRLTLRALLLIGTAVAFLLPGCQTGALKDQIKMLSEKQIFLAVERDSLQRLLDAKTHELDSLNKDYNTLSTNFKTVITKNKSLQSGYYSRGVQLKKLTQENAEMRNSLVYQIVKNDSLQNELKYLQEKIAAIDKAMADEQMNSTALAQTVKQQEEKIITDSIAVATKPEPPVFVKESGFISITEIGGGFGLGDVSTDYSKSLVSFTTIAALRVNDHFLTGFGTGVHAYNGGNFIPLYIDMRYTFKQAKFTPFITADGGVLFNLKDFNSSGLFINPAFGLEKKLTERISLHLSTGILVKEPPDWLKASFINFKGGLSFRGK
ncbi:MAG TPA: hypothetical protein VIK14_11550 [Ignavibacteria bacterium]